jgi:hypothetical protein
MIEKIIFRGAFSAMAMFLMALIQFCFAASSQADQDEWKMILNREFSFQISMPPHWNETFPAIPNLRFSCEAPDNRSQIFVTAIHDNSGLTKMPDMDKELLAMMLEAKRILYRDIEVVEEGTASVSSTKALYQKCRFTQRRGDEALQVVTLEYMFLSNGTIYSFCASYPTRDEDAVFPLVKHSLSIFRVHTSLREKLLRTEKKAR